MKKVFAMIFFFTFISAEEHPSLPEHAANQSTPEAPQQVAPSTQPAQDGRTRPVQMTGNIISNYRVCKLYPNKKHLC